MNGIKSALSFMFGAALASSIWTAVVFRDNNDALTLSLLATLFLSSLAIGFTIKYLVEHWNE